MANPIIHLSHHTPHAHTHSGPCQVPLSQAAFASLKAQYDELVTSDDPSVTDVDFATWVKKWTDDIRGPARRVGLDDGNRIAVQHTGGNAEHGRGPQKIDRPPKQLKGVVRTLVLLVEFPDGGEHKPQYTVDHYKNLLFDDGNKGSMRSYYQEISGYDGNSSGIDIQGEVHGWFMMPHPRSYYTDNQTGFGSPPQNAEGLANDAVKVALEKGIVFGNDLDALEEGVVTALFIVHSGRGAEETTDRNDIWSHKWVLPAPRKVNDQGLKVETYLTVPEDCLVGVCAHEWGHLAARWADYYDTDQEQNQQSQGLGIYCLMAAGSWGNRGKDPVYPNSMLRAFHNWVDATIIDNLDDGNTFSLKPVSAQGTPLRLRNPAHMSDTQYIVIEYRRQIGRDTYLTDQGIAIYVVDEFVRDVNNENNLAIELMQADGRRDLAKRGGTGNYGDQTDLYPNGKNNKMGRNTKPALKLPNGKFTGIELEVKGQPGDEEMAVVVTSAQ